MCIYFRFFYIPYFGSIYIGPAIRRPPATPVPIANEAPCLAPAPMDGMNTYFVYYFIQIYFDDLRT